MLTAALQVKSVSEKAPVIIGNIDLSVLRDVNILRALCPAETYKWLVGESVRGGY